MGAYLVERKEAAPGRRYKDRQCTYNVILRRVRLTTIAVIKQYYPSIIYSDCVYFCLIYSAWKAHASYDTLMSSVPSLAVPYFSTLPQKWHYFLKKKLLNVNYTFWFSLQICLENFLIYEGFSDVLSETHRGLRVKYSARYSSQILIAIELLDRHRKILRYKILTKIRPVGVELFHADRETRDGRTDRQTGI